MNDVAGVYRRVAPFARAMPLVLALPIAAELAQHVAEIATGFYLSGNARAVQYAPARMIAGVVKVLAIILVTVVATRWWAFGGDRRRALRLGGAFWRGAGVIVLVQIATAIVQAAASRLLALVAPGLSPPAALAAVLLPLIVLTAYLQPWTVGLIVEDRTMSWRRSIAGIRGRLLWSSCLLFVAVLPLMLVHYALGYGAMGRPLPLVIALLLVDGPVVGCLAVLIASGAYAIYALAAARTAGARPS